jgi:hypothetical protein
MDALTNKQMKALCEIAAQSNGKPEAFYSFSGGRTKVLGTLLDMGLLERVLKEVDGMTTRRLVATQDGRELVAAHLLAGGTHEGA